MLKRKIYKNLLEWKVDREHKPLLVKGARQVGKTFIIKEFGKNEYKSLIHLDFIKNPEYKIIFENELTPEFIYEQISIRVKDAKFIENDTLIFLDEIQNCPKARTALKYLREDKRYDIIASGSLLGIRYKEEKEYFSVPVGSETDIEMFPLDFEEFLWANGIDDSKIKILNKYFVSREKVPSDVNEKYMRYFKTYMFVGGMPEAVNTYIENQNIEAVNKKQNELLKNYQDDIMHYAPSNMKQNILKCYNSIPEQLSKDYKKFQYSIVEKRGTAKKFENPITWLIEAGMAKKCINVSTPEFPLRTHEKAEAFKIYMTDIGLLTCLYGFNTQKAIITDELKTTAKGGIYENVAFTQLMSKFEKMYYYKNENNTQEIEFVFEDETEIIPIEVKSKNGATISLNDFIEKYNPEVAYKIIDGNVGVVGTKLTIPYYMLMFDFRKMSS